MKHKSPDFIGIGAPKCGTTWIAQCLAEHPEIYIPIKEVWFFNDKKRFEKGLRWYEKLFEKCPNDCLAGEFTPSYFSNKTTSQKIYEAYPNIKLIASLRNPIQRSWSFYLAHLPYYKKFNEALKENPGVIKNSYYSIGLKQYFKYFNQDKIIILIYEDIAKNPLKFIQKIYKFLEVDDQFIPPSLNKKINVPLVLLLRIIKKIKIIKILINIVYTLRINFKICEKIISIIIIPGSNLLLNLFPKNPPVPYQLKEKLQKYYKSEIQTVEKLLNRRLPEWRV